MAILDAATLATLANRPALADPNAYDPAYIAGVISDVASTISSFLQYDPVLQVVTAEEGPAELDGSGYYQSLYRLQTKVAPFIPGTAAAIFSSLTLNYARSVSVSVPINLAYVTVRHKYGRAFLAPGALTAIAGLSFDYGWSSGSMQVIGYTASYIAGFSTGIADPTLPGPVSYGAQPMPADITQAAVLLCKERIALDDAANQQTTNASAGSLTMQRTADQEERYQPVAGGMVLGGGTALSAAAARRLARWQRTEIA